MPSSALLRAYARLPPPLRSVAASARGLYLRASRYGAETDRLVKAALDREHWTNEEWERWQAERLHFVLHRAATQVPYYRDMWAARRRSGDRRSWAYLENWPILEKDSVRATPRAFLADDCNAKRLIHEHTSGTTGKPLDVWLSRDTVRQWYALSEARSRLWHGTSRSARWAILGGQLVTPVGDRRPPFWVWNAPLHQLYMSAYHLAPDLLPYYLDALVKWRIEYLWGYPSALYELALGMLRSNRRDLQMVVAISNAEPLYPHQRSAIAKAFQCPVREIYGMAELVAGASECQCQTLHVWPEVGWTEIIDGAQPMPPGMPGELVSTGLLNVDMPLIRYRLGDRGTRPERPALCGCRRTLPTLKGIEGRSDEILYTGDGRRIGRLDTVFKSTLPVIEAQLIQETIGRLRVRYVPAPEFTPAAGRRIMDEVRARMGDVEVILEPMTQIPRTPNGKFRAVICRIPNADIEALSTRSQELSLSCKQT